MSKLKRRRELAAMSQRDLAAASSVAKSTIHELEHGQRERGPIPSTIRALATALGCLPAEIMDDEPDQVPAA